MFWTPLSRTLVRAASTSTPGQVLYPLKIHVERVQYTGASQPDVRVALALAFLGERVAEVQALVDGQTLIPDDSAAEVQVLVNLLLRSVAETTDEALPDALHYAAAQLRAYMDALGQIRTAAAPVDAQTIDMMEQSCRRGYLTIDRALAEPTEFAAAYRAGRPELFLLPGESLLGDMSRSPDSATSVQGERPNAEMP